MKLFGKKKKGVEKLISRCKSYKNWMETSYEFGLDTSERYWRTRYIPCKIILEEDFGVNVEEL